MFDFGSTWRGVKAWKPFRQKVNYAIRFKWFGSCWFHLWTPIFHDGRGPYVSIGLLFVAFYRGY